MNEPLNETIDPQHTAGLVRDQIPVSQLLDNWVSHPEEHRCPCCRAPASEMLASLLPHATLLRPTVLSAGDYFPCGACDGVLRLDLETGDAGIRWRIVAVGDAVSPEDPLPAQARAQRRWMEYAQREYAAGKSLTEITAGLAAQFATPSRTPDPAEQHMRRPGYWTLRRTYRLITSALAAGVYHAPVQAGGRRSLRVRPSLRVTRCFRNAALRRLAGLDWVDPAGTWQAGRRQQDRLLTAQTEIVCEHCQSAMRCERSGSGWRFRCPNSRSHRRACPLTSVRSSGSLSAALSAFLVDWILIPDNVKKACGLIPFSEDDESEDLFEDAEEPRETRLMVTDLASEERHPDGSASTAAARRDHLWGELRHPLPQEHQSPAAKRLWRLSLERRVAEMVRTNRPLRSVSSAELSARAAFAGEQMMLGTISPGRLRNVIRKVVVRAVSTVSPAEGPAVDRSANEESLVDRQAWRADIEIDCAALRTLLLPERTIADGPLEDVFGLEGVPLDGLDKSEQLRRHVIALRRGRIPNLTEQQIAEITGVTQPRVSQILTAAGDDPLPPPSDLVIARWDVRESRWLAQITPGPEDAWTAGGDLQRIRSLRKMLRRVRRGIPPYPLMQPLSFEESLRIGDASSLRSNEEYARSHNGAASPVTGGQGAIGPSSTSNGEVSYGPGAVLLGRFEDSFQAVPELAGMLGQLCRFDPGIESPARFIPSPAWWTAQQRYWLGRRIDRTAVDCRTVLELEALLEDLRRGQFPRNLALVGSFYLAETLRTQRIVTDAMLEAGFPDASISQTVGLPEGWIEGYRRIFTAAVPLRYTRPTTRSDQRWATFAGFFRDVAKARPWRMARVLTYLQRRGEIRLLSFGKLQIDGDLSETESLAYEIAYQSRWMHGDTATREALEDLRHELSRLARRRGPADGSGGNVSAQAVQRSIEAVLGRPFDLTVQ